MTMIAKIKNLSTDNSVDGFSQSSIKSEFPQFITLNASSEECVQGWSQEMRISMTTFKELIARLEAAEARIEALENP